MKKILLAGATGYLGSHIAKRLIQKAYNPRVMVRSPDKLGQFGFEVQDLFHAEVTRPETLKGCCKGIDTVISTVGITRQKDGLTYLESAQKVSTLPSDTDSPVAGCRVPADNGPVSPSRAIVASGPLQNLFYKGQKRSSTGSAGSSLGRCC